MDQTSSTPSIGWGILATGRIAQLFARDLALVPGAQIVAVGSRSATSAAAFAAAYADDDCTAYGSYAELAADPRVEVVYVASPHALHLEHAALCLAAGKHVLCEKPVALNARDAEELVRIARQHDRFFMEGMWMACHPLVREIRRLVRAGDFGEPRQLHADLGFTVDLPPEDRLLDPALGAGALLDMGIYPLTLAHLLLGEATALRAVAHLSDRGIDLDIAIAGTWGEGAIGALTASMTSWSPRTATLATSRGRVDVPAPFHYPSTATWTPYDGARRGEPEVILAAEPLIGVGWGNEAAEVMRCLREGLRESPLVPHAQTLTLIRQMDDLRRQVGVTYPADRDSTY